MVCVCCVWCVCGCMWCVCVGVCGVCDVCVWCMWCVWCVCGVCVVYVVCVVRQYWHINVELLNENMQQWKSESYNLCTINIREVKEHIHQARNFTRIFKLHWLTIWTNFSITPLLLTNLLSNPHNTVLRGHQTVRGSRYLRNFRISWKQNWLLPHELQPTICPYT